MSVQSRSTLYKGIQMRSRLEADFARWLDLGGRPWRYEPQCFADERGQYLPDFEQCLSDDVRLYIEVKPANFPDDQIEPLLKQMTIIWSSQPDACLQLILWSYGDRRPQKRIVADSPRHKWLMIDADFNQRLWPGGEQP
jgi:hypothetical protein